MRYLFVIVCALLGMIGVGVSLLFFMGEMSPSMRYETALPFLLAGAIAGLLGGSYLGERLHRAKRRVG
jgi:presenilin-like A22 family membrane protease